MVLEPQTPGVTPDPAAGGQPQAQAQAPAGPVVDPERGSYDPNALPPDPMNQQELQGPIPYERFSEVNNRVKVMEQQIAERDRQLQLYSAQLAQQNQGQQPMPQQQGPPPPDPIAEQIQGMIDDEYADEQTKKTGQALLAMNNRVNQQAAMNAWMAAHPDYGTLVGSPQQFADPIQNVLNIDPMIGNDIAQSANPMQTAYNYARVYQTVQQQAAQQQPPGQPPAPQVPQAGPIPNQIHPSAITAFNQARQPMSPANAGSGAGFNRAHRYSNMSEQEFANHRANVVAGQR
jgi:hypothetical protein